MKVLVTGATGRIGANVIDRLLKRNYEVIGFVFPGDPNAPKLEKLGVEIAWGDVRDTEAVDKAVARADAVMNFAALMVPPKDMPLATYEDINVKGPYNVGLAIKKHSGRIQRFLHVSSDAVYTCYNYLYTPMDEDHPKRPIYPYARVKWTAEEAMRSFGLDTGIPFSIIRPGAVSGAGEAAGGGTAASLIGQFKSNNRITSAGAFPGCLFYMPGIPEPWKMVEAQVESLDQLIIPVDERGDSWMLHTTDVRDVADGAMLAFEKDEAIGEVFNIVGPRGITWREHVEILSEKLHKPYKELVLPCPAWRYELDISKAKRLLGYNPQYGIKEKIEDSLAFLAGEDVGIVPTDVDKSTPSWEEALRR